MKSCVPLDPYKHMCYIPPQSRPETHLKEELKHHREAPETQPEDSTSKPIPQRGSSNRRHLLISPGPVSLP